MINQNEERLAFYYVIGMATTQWARIEFALAGLVSDRLNALSEGRFNLSEFTATELAFMSIASFRAKLQYVDTVIKNSDVKGPDLSTWENIQKSVKNASSKRNMIAHGHILDTPSETPGRRMMLLKTNPKKLYEASGHHSNKGALYIREIFHIRSTFVSLMWEISKFSHHLTGSLAPFPEYPEPSQNPPTLAEIRQEILAYIQPPQPPSAE